jgi:uncharacterized iron-regulated membrane protein
VTQGRRLWFSIHKWVGLVVGLWFVIAGLTGSVLVWYQEIDEFLNPALLVEHPGQQLASLDDVLESVKRAHPDKAPGPWEIGTALHPHGMIEVRFPKPPEKDGEFYAPLLVSVNPYTAEVVTSRYWGETLVTWLYELHADLLLGQPGWYVIGTMGLLLFASATSGLVLWWPGWKKVSLAFAIKLNRSRLRTLYDLHRVPATISAIVLLTLSATGALLVFGDFVRPVVESISPVPEAWEGPQVEARDSPFISVTKAVAISATAFPGSTLRWVSTPDGPTGSYRVDRRQAGEANVRFPASRVWIDPYDGQIIKKHDPSQIPIGGTFFNVLYPLHIGEALGLAARWLWFCVGFVPLLLFVTGLWMWLLRRRQRTPEEV